MSRDRDLRRGAKRSGLGIDAVCRGVDAALPGVDAACPGVDAACPGVDGACRGVDGACRGVQHDIPRFAETLLGQGETDRIAMCVEEQQK